MYGIIFFAELFLLFLLSKQVTSSLSSFLYKTTKNKHLTIHLMAWLFLPGTVIHEFSHAVMARLLFVRIHEIHFFPTMERERLKLGSVLVEKTDIFRRILIGMAPFFLGTTTIMLLLFFVTTNNYSFNNVLGIILLLYGIFEIGNTMFSSKKDLEGALELSALFLLLTGALYFFEFRIPSLALEHPLLNNTMKQGSMFMLVPIGIDLFLLFIFKILIR